MSEGKVDLRQLIEFASQDGSVAAYVGNSPEGRRFSKLVDAATKDVPMACGVYCYGWVESPAKWKAIYVGESTKLQDRFRQQLKNEREQFWPDQEERLIELGAEAYGAKWPDYESNMYRGLRRSGSTEIRWVSFDPPSSSDKKRFLRAVELLLIAKLRPTANQSEVTESAIDLAAEIAIKFEKVSFPVA